MNYKIAVITPKSKNDYLTETIIDGLLSLSLENPELIFFIPMEYPSNLDVKKRVLNNDDFLDFASDADIIFFMWGKDNTNYDLANKINRFSKTVFIDGSEVGKNGRYDKKIIEEIESGKYDGRGKIDLEMERKCALYFRREKPYLRDIIPFPFGIERKYYKYYSKETKKDIDFFCVFGQEDYPLLRKEARKILVEFSKKNNFTYFAQKTDKDNFYKTLARSKVGISVGGGGFDTARFWEILGNNCILITENIDIYKKDSKRLDYKRIFEFGDTTEFRVKLGQVGSYLRTQYKQENMEEEYSQIILDHSSKSRVIEVLEKAKEKSIID